MAKRTKQYFLEKIKPGKDIEADVFQDLVESVAHVDDLSLWELVATGKVNLSNPPQVQVTPHFGNATAYRVDGHIGIVGVQPEIKYRGGNFRLIAIPERVFDQNINLSLTQNNDVADVQMMKGGLQYAGSFYYLIFGKK